MDLFLIRHAIAEPHRQGLHDAARALTDRGQQRFVAAVRGLARLEIQLEGIFCSPSLRTVQTAELLAPIANSPHHQTTLLAQAPTLSLLELLASHEEGALALVGHEPWTSGLASWLLTGEPHGCELEVKKGSVIHLSGRPTPGTMSLKAFWTPRTLRRLGR